MKNNSQSKNVVILVLIILLFSATYVVLDKIFDKENNDTEIYLKNYEVNEIIPVYVSDEDMTKIYLNEYVHIMYSDIEKAYELLDEEYRIKKFGDINNFKNYINSLNYSSYTLDSFYLDFNQGYKIFVAYDTNGNVFIFKTDGVMQYTVYLDDYTVEI